MLSRKASSYFVCPSCSVWRNELQSATQKRFAVQRTIRRASTLRSSTAVNATRNVPASLKELDEALELLERNASAHVNSSRLKLARRGLEGDQPVVRVAGTLHDIRCALVAKH